jgi:hypothetical protein
MMARSVALESTVERSAEPISTLRWCSRLEHIYWRGSRNQCLKAVPHVRVARQDDVPVPVRGKLPVALLGFDYVDGREEFC